MATFGPEYITPYIYKELERLLKQQSKRAGNDIYLLMLFFNYPLIRL